MAPHSLAAPKPRRSREPHRPSASPPADTREVDPLRQFYDRSAKGYDRWMRLYDGLLLDDRRRNLCSRARGHTLELGVGTGLNLASYPRDVQLVGIDPSAEMLAVASRRARAIGLEVDLRLGDAQALDLADSSFDTVVATLVLSTVPDVRRAITEAWRVLKLDGQLLILDHVRSPVALVRWIEWLLDPLVSRLAHVHLLRDPLDHLGSVGFTIERSERSKAGIVEEVSARKRL